jgi:hypothetical protein
VVKVRPTSDAEVARSAVTCGKAGVYMSVATVAELTPRPVDATVETETDESPRAVIPTPSAPHRHLDRIRCHQMLA